MPGRAPPRLRRYRGAAYCAAAAATQRQRIEAGDQRGFSVLDETMHRAILDIARHGTVRQVIAAVKARLDRVRHLPLEDPDWLAMIFREHQDIVDRIAARDGDGAADAMQHHLRTVFAAAEFFEHQPPPRQEID